MHFAHVVIGLAATASAIDIYGFQNNDKCNGGATVVKTNVGPDDCAVRSSGNIFRSIAFKAIPTNWNIICQGFNAGDCKDLLFSLQSRGARDICLGAKNYSGGKYSFTNGRRSIGSEEACSAPGDCAPAKFDRMEFEEGPKYDLTKLDDELYDEMVRTYTSFFTIFKNGGTSADVPAKFDAYKLE